ncbi:hypothetical protein HWV62_19205 [Athelia sp. TMB]|nr:hypothetical protein HWV62_19205 [Athelia sp. TMB]
MPFPTQQTTSQIRGMIWTSKGQADQRRQRDLWEHRSSISNSMEAEAPHGDAQTVWTQETPLLAMALPVDQHHSDTGLAPMAMETETQLGDDQIALEQGQGISPSPLSTEQPAPDNESTPIAIEGEIQHGDGQFALEQVQGIQASTRGQPPSQARSKPAADRSADIDQVQVLAILYSVTATNPHDRNIFSGPWRRFKPPFRQRQRAAVNSNGLARDLTPVTLREMDIAFEKYKAIILEEVKGKLNNPIGGPDGADGDDEGGDDSENDDDGHRMQTSRKSVTVTKKPRRSNLGSTPKKIKGPVQPRPRSINDLHSAIRTHARQLMGRKEPDSPWTGIVADGLELEYDSETAADDCCTAKEFLVHITGKPTSSWNRSCGRVFVGSFLKEYPEYDREEAHNAWETHLRSLQSSYRLHLKSADEKDARKARNRRNERKSQILAHQQLYLRRLNDAIEVKGEYNIDLVTTVELLGKHGMSSDESDHPSGKGEATYIISRKVWRSTAVTERLRILDALHLYARYDDEARATAGAWPRFRTPHIVRESKRPAVQDLPRAYYDETFLATKPSNWRDRHVLEESCDLKVPLAIIKRAESYDLSNRQVVAGKLKGLRQRD